MSAKEAFERIFEKYRSNIESWVCTMKTYTIFHVALQDSETADEVAAELKAKDSQFLPCANVSSEGIDL